MLFDGYLLTSFTGGTRRRGPSSAPSSPRRERGGEAKRRQSQEGRRHLHREGGRLERVAQETLCQRPTELVDGIRRLASRAPVSGNNAAQLWTSDVARFNGLILLEVYIIQRVSVDLRRG